MSYEKPKYKPGDTVTPCLPNSPVTIEYLIESLEYKNYKIKCLKYLNLFVNSVERSTNPMYYDIEAVDELFTPVKIKVIEYNSYWAKLNET